jgi:NAD(P)-dependent dehydrogenase (short-subunit alcohol dehydrogenase family)
MDLLLNGRKAIVTGGRSGIGKAVARELALEGVDVAIASRNLEALEETARELAAESGRVVVPVAFDATFDDSIRAMVAAAAERLGGVDILVNAAAEPDRPPHPTVDELGEEQFLRELTTKVLGYARTIREVVPLMEQRGGGRIVNIAGTSVYRTGSTIGTVRNAGVAALTKNLADELAPRNIQVVAVHPATTRTEGTPATVAAVARARGITEEQAAADLEQGNLLGRMVEAHEIADLVAFLVSSRAISVNGEFLVASGGTPGTIRY